MASLAAAAAIASIVGAGATTYKALTSKPKGAPPMPTVAKAPTNATADQDAEAKRQARARIAQQRAASEGQRQRDTILTSGRGAIGSAPVERKSLLGL